MAKSSGEQTPAEKDLFEKVFLQCAHIAILEEALQSAEQDIERIANEHDIDVSEELERIAIAYRSVLKLRNMLE